MLRAGLFRRRVLYPVDFGIGRHLAACHHRHSRDHRIRHHRYSGPMELLSMIHNSLEK